jgi:hypothetical protein
MDRKYILSLIPTLVIAFSLSGCGSTPNNMTGSVTDESAVTNTDSIDNSSSDDSAKTDDISTEDTKPEDIPEGNRDIDNDQDLQLYQSYLDNTLKVNDTYFLDKYMYEIEDFGEVQAYYYDIDEDGKKELLVNELFYGFDIYDVKDGSVYLLTAGDGTAAFCSVYENNGHIYIGHSDFTHMGRKHLDLSRYDADGNIVEEASIYADYFDSETDQYDESSTFIYNDKSITMQEYEAYMESYRLVDPEEMEKAEYNSIDVGSAPAADYNIYEEYRTIVDQTEPSEWDRFQLIDLDADGQPELFATCTDENRPDAGMQPYMIVGYNQQGIVMNDEFADGVASAGGYRGTLYYLPGTGKLLDSAVYAPLGLPSDTIYEMKDGAITYTEYGGFNVTEYPDDTADENWDPMEHGEWEWMDETVSEDEYKQKFLAATENTTGKAMNEIDYMDKESMLKELEKLIQ